MHRALEIAQIIQGIEDAEHIDAVRRGSFDEPIHNVVGVMTIADEFRPRRSICNRVFGIAARNAFSRSHGSSFRKA